MSWFSREQLIEKYSYYGILAEKSAMRARSLPIATYTHLYEAASEEWATNPENPNRIPPEGDDPALRHFFNRCDQICRVEHVEYVFIFCLLFMFLVCSPSSPKVYITCVAAMCTMRSHIMDRRIEDETINIEASQLM